ncbi:CBS domain-containing protein [Legionella cincinnatiensis]|uniref:Inosine 5'-monophosphate dehydrogenase n=1 Tax=Legionella cincinnatiensis TaxID=28085 RepID=A0A378ING0_9GAMM|nr:CBS domain-containing protein [Legionella cincinnatiensis]KTC83305.1 inosine 5'-monophosphate dehydrogenase [Legionella cincinnatiensis]STX36716.1 putative manganese-dependent inorganic pyrophosphatase [Legionella cincinnatiensis]
MAFIEAFVEEIVPVAQKRLVTVRDEAPLMEAAKFLDGRHINLVVVCDKDGAMVGIITRTDVVRMMAVCQGCGCTVPVATVMTKEVTYCHPNDLLRNVWATMKEQNLLHVPIVDENFKPLGVINARDALLVLMEKAEFESSLLRDYVMNVGYR